MARTFTDQERAAIARGWAASGLPQDTYAASYGVTGRCLRAWLRKYAPSQPPLQRVEAILVEMMAKLQAVLDDVRAEQEDRAGPGIEDKAVVERAQAALDNVFRQEHQAEAIRPRRHHGEPIEDAPPARPSRRSFFQDLHSECWPESSRLQRQ